MNTLIKIGVAMQPEPLVAATLAVSQERKSFTTNHTSILKLMHKTWPSSMLNAAILKISMGQTNTHTHKTTTVTLAAHAHRGLISIYITSLYGASSRTHRAK